MRCSVLWYDLFLLPSDRECFVIDGVNVKFCLIYLAATSGDYYFAK